MDFINVVIYNLQHTRQLHINIKDSTGMKIIKGSIPFCEHIMIGNDTFNIHMFSTIEEICNTNNRSSIQEQLKKLANDSFRDRMKFCINDRKLLSKINHNAVFNYVNQEII